MSPPFIRQLSIKLQNTYRMQPNQPQNHGKAKSKNYSQRSDSQLWCIKVNSDATKACQYTLLQASISSTDTTKYNIPTMAAECKMPSHLPIWDTVLLSYILCFLTWLYLEYHFQEIFNEIWWFQWQSDHFHLDTSQLFITFIIAESKLNTCKTPEKQQLRA